MENNFTIVPGMCGIGSPAIYYASNLHIYSKMLHVTCMPLYWNAIVTYMYYSCLFKVKDPSCENSFSILQIEGLLED